MQATKTKKQLNLHEPEAALAWMDAFKARCRAEKKADVPAAGTTPVDLQVTDQVIFRCDVESLMNVKSLVAPTKVETMAFNEKETVLENTCSREKDLLLPNKQESCNKQNVQQLQEAEPFCKSVSGEESNESFCS